MPLTELARALLAKREAYISSMGYSTSETKLWGDKWRSLISGANKKGVKCLLTFEEYVLLAYKAGITTVHQIGKSIKHYQMGRLGDTGNYEVGNCRFITMRQNLTERADNGGNYRTAEAMSKRMTGLTKENNSGVASMAKKLSKDFRVTAPDGQIYEGRNLKEFCEQNSLYYNCMQLVCKGRKRQYKGWTGEYV